MPDSRLPFHDPVARKAVDMRVDKARHHITAGCVIGFRLRKLRAQGADAVRLKGNGDIAPEPVPHKHKAVYDAHG